MTTNTVEEVEVTEQAFVNNFSFYCPNLKLDFDFVPERVSFANALDADGYRTDEISASFECVCGRNHSVVLA